MGVRRTFAVEKDSIRAFLMSGRRILWLSDAPAAQNAITECGLTVTEDPAQVRPESSREGLPWLELESLLAA